MDYHTLTALRRNHPGWRLLSAGNGPFIISFLHPTFIQPNVRVPAQSELGIHLDDFLYRLHQGGEERFSRSAIEYLVNWSDDEHGRLRKFYPDASDEPHYDLTPAMEKAIQWFFRLRWER